ncbi:MAG: hypothetical protein IKW00_05575 [Clostridia bacterium]|nr:hypothetical protein [Clostridia bacterium]
MNISENFDKHDLIHMMFEDESIDTFKSLWNKNKGSTKWSDLLHMCYWEASYERVGGDYGYLENPPINVKRIKYLEELIAFLEGAGVQAVNDAPKVK